MAPSAPVIIISIDTLRADHLPIYGYTAVDTPAIDRLRADSILFEHAYTACPLTLPAHVSLLTGVAPPLHGVRDNIGYRLDAKARPTLAQALGTMGYATGAAISAYVLRGRSGVSAGFDAYDDRLEITAHGIGELQRRGQDTVDVAKAWIGRHRDRPFFFFLHLYEPHTPYDPPAPFRDRYSLPYDGEIAATDAAVGDFLDHLRRLGLYDRAILFLLSDHGEGLGDHGEEEHGILLHRETIRVPLLLKLPDAGRGGTTVSEPVQLLDVFPTVAELVGLAAPAALPGRSLLALGQGASDAPPSRRLYSETFYPRLHLAWSELRSLVDGRYHLIDGPNPELYDIVEDPRETTNVAQDERRVLRAMRDELRGIAADLEAPQRVDRREVEKLAALGYLGTPADAGDGPLPDPKDGLPVLARVKSGLELAQAGRHAEAAELLESILDEHPGMFDVRFQLCKSLTALGRLQEALDHYRRGIELAPVLADGLVIEAGRLHLQLGRLDEAQAHARTALDALPVEAHQLLAEVALARGDPASALEEARLAAASEDPPRADSLLLLAGIHLRREEHEVALSLLDGLRSRVRAGKLAPVRGLELERGEALGRLSRYGEAAEAFQEEILHFPGHARAYSRLTYVYAAMGRFAEIDPTLEAMVRANPRPDTLLLAAETAERLGDEEGARTWRRRASSSRGS